ncbi:MAG: RNA polymerase sigma factor [Bacteroidia bacterium]
MTINNNQNSSDFLNVLEAHKGILWKVARSYCSDTDDQKDLVQEITVQLWRSFHNYNSEYKYSTWIYRIALNTAISFYRRETRRQQVSAPLNEGVLTLAENHQETNEQLLLLQQFIAELREIDKALMLLYLDEKSYKEIAEILGISLSNVATKIGRIKAELKLKFSKL